MIEIIVSAMDSFLIYYFIDRFTERETDSKFRISLMILSMTAVIVSFSTIPQLNNSISKIPMFVLIYLTTRIVFDIPFHRGILLIISAGIIFAIIELPIISILVLKFGVSSDYSVTKGFDYLIIGLVSKPVVFVILKYSSKHIQKIKFLNKKSSYQIALVLMINFLICIIAGWYHRYFNYQKVGITEFIIILFFSIFIFSFLTIKLTSRIINLTSKEVEWVMKEEGYVEQTHYVKTMDELFNNLKSQRHEFNNHLHCLFGLINNDDYGSAKQYINELELTLKDYTEIVKTSNPILSSLLNVKYKEAKNNNIDINFEILDINEMRMELIDLTIIIGNILDNAIGACKKIEHECKNINLSIYTKNNHFCIHLINSKKSGMFYKNEIKFSTKENKEDHGYGLSNVRYVVEKYGGKLKITDKEKDFDLKIYIQTTQLTKLVK